MSVSSELAQFPLSIMLRVAKAASSGTSARDGTVSVQAAGQQHAHPIRGHATAHHGLLSHDLIHGIVRGMLHHESTSLNTPRSHKHRKHAQPKTMLSFYVKRPGTAPARDERVHSLVKSHQKQVHERNKKSNQQKLQPKRPKSARVSFSSASAPSRNLRRRRPSTLPKKPPLRRGLSAVGQETLQATEHEVSTHGGRIIDIPPWAEVRLLIYLVYSWPSPLPPATYKVALILFPRFVSLRLL